MSTALAKQKPEVEPILLSVTADTVASLSEKCLAVRINGIDDKAGRALAHTLRMECVKARKTCEREHATVKEQALRECQRIDQSRRDIVGKIEALESHIESEEAKVKAELDRIEQARVEAIYQERLKQWTAVEGPATDRAYLLSMQDDQFAARIAQQLELERRTKEAEERARVETEARLKREAEEAERARQEAEAERQREESMRPDREKLLTIAEQLRAIVVPAVKEASVPQAAKIQQILTQAAYDIELALKPVKKARVSKV